MLRNCAVLVALGMTGTQMLLKQILYEFELVEAVFVRYGCFQGLQKLVAPEGTDVHMGTCTICGCTSVKSLHEGIATLM
jgi:hypothetical protein